MSEKAEETVRFLTMCSRCEKHPQGEAHPCPYLEEIRDDHVTTCDCCDECTHECAMDV